MEVLLDKIKADVNVEQKQPVREPLREHQPAFAHPGQPLGRTG